MFSIYIISLKSIVVVRKFFDFDTQTLEQFHLLIDIKNIRNILDGHLFICKEDGTYNL